MAKMSKSDVSTPSLLDKLIWLAFAAGAFEMVNRVFLVTTVLAVGLLSVSEFWACVSLVTGCAYVLLAMLARQVALKIWQASSHSGRLDDRLGNREKR